MCSTTDSKSRPFLREQNFFPPNSPGMSKTSRMTKILFGTKKSRSRKKISPKKSKSRPLIRGKNYFSKKSSGMSKTSKMMKIIFGTQTSCNLSRSSSRDVKVIDIDSCSLCQDASLCKFYANLRVIQMVPNVKDRVTGRQLHSGQHNTEKHLFQRRFAV